MRLEFRLLGPVELRRDGEPVSLGPAKRSAMLASLLVERNRPVPIGRLREALWSGAVPPSAVANLRTHASVLRRIVGRRLVTVPGGYQLTVNDAELDAAEFSRLAAAGKDALASGDVPRALVNSRAALAYWRGSAGGEMPTGTWLSDVLSNLDEQRLAVFEDYVEARLLSGANRELVGELRRHLAAQPLRERPWRQLMVALYRSGQVAEALGAYRQARTMLQEHLGMEPGRELQQLQRAILNRDSALDGPALRQSACRTGAGGLPHPHRPPNEPAVALLTPGPGECALTGRSDELRCAVEVVSKAAAEGGSVVICGRAGVGKSALAQRVARLVAHHFPDGEVYLDLTAAAVQGASRHPGDEILAALLRALGMGADGVPPTVTEKAALVRSLTAGRRLLVILDNVRTTAQVRPLLSAAASVTILITSRRKLAAPVKVSHLRLRPLLVHDAVRMLAGLVGASRVEKDPVGAAAIARACDGLPMAIHIAGARLADRTYLPLSTLVQVMAANPLDALEFGDVSMRNELARDYPLITSEDHLAGSVFPLLGGLRPDEGATVSQVAVRLGEPEGRVFGALERLVDGHMAEVSQPSCYRAPGLLRHYAAELAAR